MRFLTLSILSITGAIAPMQGHAAVTFTGVSAGDITSNSAIIWTRAIDGTLPATLTLRLATNAANLDSSNLFKADLKTDASTDFTLKFPVTGLQAGTVYFYQFTGAANEKSAVGKFKTAPEASTAAAVSFGFSGNMDGLMRPYALAITVPAQNFDFFVNLGDVIYENASNVYLGLSVTNNHVYYKDAKGVLQDVGAFTEWLKTAGC